ncbi:MAG: hypothetical protein ACTSQB_04820 [Candidatus Heimdallarchaeota archaeon]
MMQNILVLKDGSTLVNENFGDCRSIHSNPILLSGFFEALLSFSEEMHRGKLEQLQFENASVNFLKMNGLVFIAVCDKIDSLRKIKKKLSRIAEIFWVDYEKYLTNFSGEITVFSKFKEKLLKFEIVHRNCGKYTECTDCPNHLNDNPIVNEVLEKRKKRKN